MDPDVVDVSGDGRFERDGTTPLVTAASRGVAENVVQRGVGGARIVIYRVRLGTRPLAPLTVDIVANNSDSALSVSQVTFSPSVLYFDPTSWRANDSTPVTVTYGATPTPAPTVPSALDAATSAGRRLWNSTHFVDDANAAAGTFPFARVGADGTPTVEPLAKSAIFIALLPDEANGATDNMMGRTALRWKRRRMDGAADATHVAATSRRRLLAAPPQDTSTSLGTSVGWLTVTHSIRTSTADVVYAKVAMAASAPREGEGGMGFISESRTGVAGEHPWGYEGARRGSIVILRGSNAQNRLYEGEEFGRNYGVTLSRQPLVDVQVLVQTTSAAADEAEKMRQWYDGEVLALSKAQSDITPQISLCADRLDLRRAALGQRIDAADPASWYRSECTMGSATHSGGKDAVLLFTPQNWYIPRIVRLRAVDDELYEEAIERTDYVFHTIVALDGARDTDPAYDATRRNRYNMTVANANLASNNMSRRYPIALGQRGGGAVAKNVVAFTSIDRAAALFNFGAAQYIAWDRRRTFPDRSFSNSTHSRHLWLVEAEGDASLLATRGGDTGSGYAPAVSMGDRQASARTDAMRSALVEPLLGGSDGSAPLNPFVGVSSELGAAAQPTALSRYAPGVVYSLRLSQAPPTDTVVVVRVVAEKQGAKLFGSATLGWLLSDVLGIWPIAELCGHERLRVVPRVLLFDAQVRVHSFCALSLPRLFVCSFFPFLSFPFFPVLHSAHPPQSWNATQDVRVTARDDLDYQGAAQCVLRHVATSARSVVDAASNASSLVEGDGDGRFRSAHRSGNLGAAAFAEASVAASLSGESLLPSIGLLWIARQVDDAAFDGVVHVQVDDDEPWWMYRVPLVTLGWILFLATALVLILAAFVAAYDCASPSANTWGLLAEAQVISLVTSTAGVRSTLQGLALVGAALDPLAMRAFGLLRSAMLGGATAPWPFSALGIGHIAPVAGADASSDFNADARVDGGIAAGGTVEHAPRHPAVAPATAAFFRWFDVRDGNPLVRDGAASWLLVQLLPWLLLVCVSLGCVRSLLHRCFLSRRWRACWGEKCVCTKKWCCKGEQRQPIAPAGTQWPRWEVAVCTWFLRPLAAASAAALPLALFGFANPMAHSAGSTISGADYDDAASIGALGGGENASAALLEGAAAAALADATGAISTPRLELTVRVIASGAAALARGRPATWRSRAGARAPRRMH